MDLVSESVDRLDCPLHTTICAVLWRPPPHRRAWQRSHPISKWRASVARAEQKLLSVRDWWGLAKAERRERAYAALMALQRAGLPAELARAITRLAW